MPKHYLKEQMSLHPSMEARDIVKMCFQAAFGAEHLLVDAEKARQYFDNELEGVQEQDGPLVELIADDVCRVNLAVWKKMGLPAKQLFDLFVESAKIRREDGEEVFWEYMARAGELVTNKDEWREFVDEYMKGGIRAVNHSDAYRESEKPAYRVISGEFVQELVKIEKEGM